MDEVYQVVLKVLAAFFVTGILSFLLTPPVKRLAHRIGAIDVPKDARRMHKNRFRVWAVWQFISALSLSAWCSDSGICRILPF